MKSLFLLCMALLLSACDKQPQTTSTQTYPPGNAQAAEKAAAALKPFKQKLMQALTDGLQQGPVAALDKCQLEAPMIAASLSQDGIRVGRSSQRLRNPGNAPNDWQQAGINYYLQHQGSTEAQSYALSDGSTGYVEPIYTAPLCLNCHGSNLAPAVNDAIRHRYPDDQATGFKVGDLRGIFWVQIPAS